jgi:23S rRNA pseudouridine1911/1915/1917 synthase
MQPNLVVLYEDSHCLAVVKPAGLLTQAPPGIDSLEARAKDYLKNKYQKQGRIYLGVPHRLDRPVSGVVLFARQSVSAKRLSEQFRDRQVTKTYWGAVEGEVQPLAGTWHDWLRKVENEARVEKADEGTPGAQLAQLDYRCVQSCEGGTLVEFRPETGRMHQIRVQAALRGWPIRGDLLYGAHLSFGSEAELARDRIIALHGRSLTFLHPVRYEPITVTAPLPEEYWSAYVSLFQQ